MANFFLGFVMRAMLLLLLVGQGAQGSAGEPSLNVASAGDEVIEIERNSSFVSWYEENLPRHSVDVLVALVVPAAMYLFQDSSDFLAAFLGLFFAEILTAHFHWWEDTYSESSPAESIACPNALHHIVPREIITHSPWFTCKEAVVILGPLIALAKYHEMPTTFYTLLFSSITNWVHQMAHLSPLEVRRVSHLIALVQKMGLMQSYSEHAKHHRAEFRDINYCALTNFGNKLFENEFWNYWRRLENLVQKSTGLKPRATREMELYAQRCTATDKKKWPFRQDWQRLAHSRRDGN